MPKKIIIILIGFLLFSGARPVFAGPVINEIMYAPANGSNYEWVEIYNPDSSPVDLAKYRFCKDDACDNSSPFALKQGDSSVLQPSEYAIIAKSLSGGYAWLNFSGVIFSASNLSLPDNSSTDNTYIAISDPNKVILDSIKYDTNLGGNKETNTSLSKIDNIWKAGLPTPGAQNKESSTAASSSFGTAPAIENPTLNTTLSSASSKTKTAELLAIKTKIFSKPVAFAGLPVNFSASAEGLEGEVLHFGKYFWNFGDGGSEEANLNEAGKFTHTYFYPGEYDVSLEYYENSYSENPDATDNFILKVIPVDISISSVGDEKDFFVELSNNSGYDADISGWYLSSATKSFVFPKNTLLQPKKKIIISSKITGFSVDDKDNLKLMTPQKETAYDYSTSAEPALAQPVSSTVKFFSSSADKIPSKNLTASAVSVEAWPLPNKNSSNYLFWGGLAGLLALAGSVAYFWRRKNLSLDISNDFDILDE